MGQTIAEKIFSRKIARPVAAGDFVDVEVDFAMCQDSNLPFVLSTLKEVGAKQIAMQGKTALILDHSSPCSTAAAANLHRDVRDWAKQGSYHLYDVGEGICHQLMLEKGHVQPGMIIVGTDSHSCTYGALNALGTGIGSTEMVSVLLQGKLWFKVPESIKAVISGSLPPGVYAKDVALDLLRQITTEGANYCALEFAGDGISRLSIDERATIANMAVEMGAKAGIFPCDEVVKEWLNSINVSGAAGVIPDADAGYRQTVETRCGELEPLVALPHSPDNVMPVSALGDTRIEQAYLGTCTNGRLSDLRIAAGILKNRRVAAGVRLLIQPASRGIYAAALQEQLIETFIAAGAVILPPGCGSCVGTHMGIPADDERVISSANRNFKGRMGNNLASVFLASPATVAASAVMGKIADPRDMIP